jgi:hypothetical protein
MREVRQRGVNLPGSQFISGRAWLVNYWSLNPKLWPTWYLYSSMAHALASQMYTAAKVWVLAKI